MKKVWIGIAAGLVVLAIAGGAFWGGMAYGRSRAIQAGGRFFQEGSGGQGVPFSPEGFAERGGQFPGAMATRQAGRGGGAAPGGGIMGTIQAVEGDVLVVNTGDGTVRVQVADTTLIEKTMPVGIDDLEVDEQVVVIGRQNDDGTITARSIQHIRLQWADQQAGGE